MQSVLARDKIFAHPERLDEWIRYGITKPITAEIDPTNYCNHNCPYCTGNRTDAKAELSLDEMKYIICQVSPFLKGIIFTGGGEPLMNERTPEAINYAKNKGIDVGLITNGILINEYDVEQILSDCAWIRVSIDAINPEHYAIARGTDKSEFQRVWKNVRMMSEIKCKKYSKCTIGVGYLTDDESSEQLTEFVRTAKEAGVDYAQFRPYYHSRKNLLPRIEECKSLDSENFQVIASEDKYKGDRFDCEIAFADEFRFVIAANGNMYPCCFTRGIDNFSYGSILEKGFHKIWFSEERRQATMNKLRQTNCPERCYEDPRNKILWDIHKDPEKNPLDAHEASKMGRHLNFV